MTDWYSRAREEDGRTDEEVMSEVEYKRMQCIVMTDLPESSSDQQDDVS